MNDRLRQLEQLFRGFLRANDFHLNTDGWGNPLGGTTTGRYVVLRANCGHDNQRLVDALIPATLYQLIPWDTGALKPQVYLDRQRVAVEAPLPKDEQQAAVKLSELTESQHGGRVVVLGPNEYGTTISLPLVDMIHVLIGGETGSGKTYTMRSFACQLANGRNRIVLIDGKHGDGLGILNGVPGQVGPLAVEPDTIRNALGWVHSEMLARYAVVMNDRNGHAWASNEGPEHILVFFDEVQVYRDDKAVMGLLHDLAAMGRSARVHLVAGTQKPTVRMFGPDVGGATRDQFGTRIAHAVATYQASNAIIGAPEPRADYLQPQGDAYVLANIGNYPLRERVQIAYVPEDEITFDGTPELDRWPEYEFEDTGAGRPRIRFSDEQIAASIIAAQQGLGRGKLQDILTELEQGISGAEPAMRLLEMGRNIKNAMDDLSV